MAKIKFHPPSESKTETGKVIELPNHRKSKKIKILSILVLIETLLLIGIPIYFLLQK